MSLRNKIDEDYIQSIKSKDQQKIDTLRLIRSAIKDKDISSRTGEKKEGINDAEILSLLLNLIKQRKDSIEQFQKAKRNDLIKNEQNEIEVIKEYLPLQKSEEETTKIMEAYGATKDDFQLGGQTFEMKLLVGDDEKAYMEKVEAGRRERRERSNQNKRRRY